jgi:hypothetical protein
LNRRFFDGATPGSYSKTHPERQIGEVDRIWASKNIVRVKWSDGSKSLHKSEQLTMEKRKVNAAMIVIMLISEVLKKNLIRTIKVPGQKTSLQR